MIRRPDNMTPMDYSELIQELHALAVPALRVIEQAVAGTEIPQPQLDAAFRVLDRGYPKPAKYVKHQVSLEEAAATFARELEKFPEAKRHIQETFGSDQLQ